LAETGVTPRSKNKMSDSELKALLDSQKMSALASVWASKLASERDDALLYYMNDMAKDMPAMDGRSQAVSSDVADTIEGLMPALMEIFTGSEDVVKFNPVGPEDVQAAEQETDYVNHVFMNENPGFLVLYSMIKDALLSKVGVVKVWWEETEEIEEETYHDLDLDSFAILTADQEVEVTEHTEHDGLHDVKISKKKNVGRAKCLGVPPEEFGIEKTARSLRLHECNYCFHRVIISQNRLLEQGYDGDIVQSLPTYTAVTMPEEINRDTVAEHQNVGSEHNPAARRVEVVEHYVRMDYLGDGRARLYKVVTGGEQGQLLYKEGKLDCEEIDEFPFAAMTPVIMTHRFFGRSLADLIMEVQRIKTALVRGLLDNLYLVNNARVEVAESHASDNTLDDLLISRPGGIVRTKQPGGLNPLQVQAVGNNVYPALEYFDQVREMRSGVTKQGQGIDADALQNQSATAVNQMFSMAQAKMKLIARIFAETGIRDLFLLMHGLIRRHGQEARTVRLRNQWVQVDPRDWKKRNDMTVDVGLGTGGKAEQMALINMIIAMQEKALMGGLTNLVTPQNLYNSAKELTKIAGKKDTDTYFTNPATQPPPQAPPDPKLQIEMLKAQSQHDLQTQKQQTEAVHESAKLQANYALEQQKFEHQKELAFLEMGMKQKEMEHKIAIDHHKAQLDVAVTQQKMSADRQTHEQDMQLAQTTGKVSKEGKGNTHVIVGDKHAMAPVTDGLKGLGEQHAASLAPIHEALKQHGEALQHIMKSANAPKRHRVHRGKDGRIAEVETIS